MSRLSNLFLRPRCAASVVFAVAASVGLVVAHSARASSPHEPPAVALWVDLDRYELGVSIGALQVLAFRVATGMPAHPTPIGDFELTTWISNPTFTPGVEARERGATAVSASMDGPLGVAKIPIEGAHLLHAGGTRYSIGKPVTLGCIQLTNEQMNRLDRWLESQGLFGPSVRNARGELERRFRRALRLSIR